ncbi:MAG TPA: response regulator [Candidatus Dormibacteraeota bacterium]|jgi:two-component system cell cycle sensor histidine kinase/response regulator CckA
MALATVLVVDDYDEIRELTEAILSSAGYRVLSAGDAESALTLAAAHPEGIDLLVSDVSLPGMHGADLARALLKTMPRMRVVLTSGSLPEPGDEPVPGTKFLQKPFVAEMLLSAISETLGSP